MSESRRQIDAMLFKPVSGGFIYRAPNPWIFGRASHYIVNEEQKAELLGMLVAPRPLLRVIVIVAGVLAWGLAMGTVGWFLSDHEDPTIGDTVVMILMSFAAMFVALHLALRSKLRRMQPILAAATPTSAVITAGDIHTAIRKTTSLKGAMIGAAMCAFGCAAQLFTLIIRNPHHPLFSDVQSGLSVFILVLCGAMAAGYFVRAIGTVRQRSPIRQ